MEALRKCLVLDALSAWLTFDLCRAARVDTSATASDYLSSAEMLAIRAVSEEERILPRQLQSVEPPEDVLWWVSRMAGLAGFHPCKGRPLPGNEKLRQAWQLLRPMPRATEALLKALHRQQAAGVADRGRAWPSAPTWPDLQAARVANWSPPEQVDSERLSHASKPA